jgi:hypothetical protein
MLPRPQHHYLLLATRLPLGIMAVQVMPNHTLLTPHTVTWSACAIPSMWASNMGCCRRPAAQSRTRCIQVICMNMNAACSSQPAQPPGISGHMLVLVMRIFSLGPMDIHAGQLPYEELLVPGGSHRLRFTARYRYQANAITSDC